MVLIQVLNKSFERLGYLTDESDKGLFFYDDRLNTSIEGGVYTFDFKVDKTNPQHVILKEGNLITFTTPRGVNLLLTIMGVDENTRGVKQIYCDDTTLNLINRVVEEQEAPASPQPIEHYIDKALDRTGWEIGDNESDKTLILDFNSTETLLSRVRKIIKEFEMEFYFETDIDPPGAPDFKLHIVKQRLEGEEGFRVTSDDLLSSTGRKVDLNNIVTRLIVRGNEIRVEPSVNQTESEPTVENRIAVDPQPGANKYDASKRNGATAVSTIGWKQSEVDQFRMNQADPPYVNGKYIDDFLRNRYPHSSLIGHGDYLKKSADYFGIAVGAALGVWAKETVFGRTFPGKAPHYNFGCIRYVRGNQGGFGATPDGAWTSYGNVKAGINAWMWLLRYGYVESGQVYYRDFLNKYSPSFENNQAEFKNLMWGVLKSFGYAMPDTALKKNYSKKSDNPRNVDINIPIQYAGGVAKAQPTTSGKSVHDDRIDKMIKWFTDRKGKVRYSMAARTGPNSYDCSSAVYSALRHAGFKTNINYLGSTVSLWNDIGANKLMTEIPRNQARRGDLFLSGARGAASAGASGHTGVFLTNDRILHCSGSLNGIVETGMNYAGSPVYCFRLNNKDGNKMLDTGQSTTSVQTKNPDGISDKLEKAVQRALSQVGGRYVWGGTAFKANDCSGLIYESYRYAGFPINHRCTTYTIRNQTYPFKKISKAEARRGDLAITNGGGHVEILLGRPGSGKGIVHAASPALGIMTQKNNVGAVLGYYRVMGDEAKGGGTQSSGSTFTHYPTVPGESQLNHMYASPYGYSSHRGIDIVYTTGNSDIFAVADGVVTQTQNGCQVGNSSCGGGWGNHVIIKHNNGYSTVYAHLSKSLVKRGQQVKGGQKIGLMGNTGNSTGKHLHLEVLASNGVTKLNPNKMFDWSGYKSLFKRWWL